MLRFRVRNIVPPGGRYFYEVPETGDYVEGLTFSGLLTTLRAAYAKLEQPAPADLVEKVEDYMCRHLPEGFCYGDLDGRPRARVVTLRDIQEATMRLASGNPRVPPGDARVRNGICGRCEKNDRTMCPSCVGLVSWARRVAGSQLGAADDWVGVCLVDLTAIAAKVHMQNIPGNEGYPEGCWARTKS